MQQTYLQIRAAIVSGYLKAGAKLPSSRVLAERIGVSCASVVSAFEQLTVEGYLAARVGSGTYVLRDGHLTQEKIIKKGQSQRETITGQASKKPLRADGRRVDPATGLAYSDDRPFNMGRTLLDARTIATWRRLNHRAVRSLGPSDLEYTDPCGLPEVRHAVSEYLQAARAVRCNPEQVLICSGTQHAIDLAIRVLLRQGDEAWVEDPGYPLTRHALLSVGMIAKPVPVDVQGIMVSNGLRIAPRARAAFVTPSHQYPTGVVLSMARRIELLTWARERGSWIIEDDYVSEFRYSGRPLSSLQGLDEDERVIYVGTLNKALFPGLRLGYAIVPRPLISAFAEMRVLMDRQPPTFSQKVAASFLNEGHLAAHIRRMRLQYRAQRDVLAAELTRVAGDRLTIAVPDQGMHMVAYLHGNSPGSDIRVEQAALREGIVVRAMSRTYINAPCRSALMLGFSGYSAQVLGPVAVRLGGIIKAVCRFPFKNGRRPK